MFFLGVKAEIIDSIEVVENFLFLEKLLEFHKFDFIVKVLS